VPLIHEILRLGPTGLAPKKLPPARPLDALRRKAESLPIARGQEVVPRLWLPEAAEDIPGRYVITPPQVLDRLR
jgi:hypothetical protein